LRGKETGGASILALISSCACAGVRRNKLPSGLVSIFSILLRLLVSTGLCAETKNNFTALSVVETSRAISSVGTLYGFPEGLQPMQGRIGTIPKLSTLVSESA
jgi:hypothetical protein